MMRALTITITGLVFFVCSCHQQPKPKVVPIPAAAQATITKLHRSALATDFASLRTTLEDSIVTEIGEEPIAANTAVAKWQVDASLLSGIAASIDGGCESTTNALASIVCPRSSIIAQAPADKPVFVILLRAQGDG